MAQQTAKQADHGLKFSGIVWARLKGAQTWYDMGNTKSLTIKAQSDKDERISFRHDTLGQALDAIYTPKPPEIAWENDTFNRRNFAAMLMGNAADFAGTPTAVTNELVTLKKGEWVKLANADIDPTQPIALTEKDGGKEIKGFEINHPLGLIWIPADSTAKEEAKINYSHGTGGGFTVDAATLNNLTLELMIDGVNRATGERGVLNVWEASVIADGDMDWLSGEWGSAKFTGTCITPAGQASPYRLTYFAK